ncbi:MAG: cell envelope integrity protein TolA [Gammaproteobacteria bacterium]
MPRPVGSRLRAISRSKSFYYSVLLHTVLILVVILGIDWKSKSILAPASAPTVMKARAIDAGKVAAEVEKLKQAEQQKIDAERERQHDAEARVKHEQERLEKLKLEQVEVARQKEVENRRLEAETTRLEKARETAAIQKKKAEAEKQRIEEQSHRAAEAEKRRAAEAEAKRRAEANAKRQDEENEKRKQDAAKAEAALREALAKEEAEQTAAAQARQQASQDATEVQRYLARIHQAISNRFVYPPGLPSGLKCTLSVRIIPGGEVIEARVVQSSGNPVFDRQAENAVLKASPLPVPEEPRLLNKMREFNVLFEPES